MFNEVIDLYRKKFTPERVNGEGIDPVFATFLQKVAKNLTESKDEGDPYLASISNVETIASSSYIDELKSIDKVSSTQSKLKEAPSIREMVAEQIREYNGNYNMQFPNHLFSEAGGGDNEYFHNGGTMKGSLTVNGNLDIGGKYLSNGVEINLGIGSGVTTTTVTTNNTTLTLALSDASTIKRLDTSLNNILVIIPIDSVVSFNIGTQLVLANISTNVATVSATTGVTIISKDNKFNLSSRGSVASLFKTSTDEWLLVGDLTA
jgi:hypothetical protein